MKIKDQRILLTGASGGIGRPLANELVARGARVGLVGRSSGPLARLAGELNGGAGEALAIPQDLTTAGGRDAARRAMQEVFGGIDVLINNAGTADFSHFVDQDPEVLERIFRLNVLAPMQLTRAVLPELLERGRGLVVNLGSVLGSIAFPCFASYSASKFALRGFSEALRRELDGSGVGVIYIAPRAVKTGLNSPAVYRMAAAVKMTMDDPEAVARQVVRAVESEKKEVYLGFPETLFVRLNHLLPRLVDRALGKQNRVMQRFTRDRSEPKPEAAP
jgi:short-subunit dehydrogenase